MSSIIVDAFRHYLGHSEIIVEGFLGVQNPELTVRKEGDNILVLAVTNLSLTPMRVSGNFGVDISLPFSEVKKLAESFASIGFSSVSSNFHTEATFNPEGTEQGNKKVPEVIYNFGRIRYALSYTCYKNQKYCAKNGWLYIDIETHNESDHETWQNNPVMEAFELHFGIRGRLPRKDPFTLCGDCEDCLHITTFHEQEARELASVINYIAKNFDYSINREVHKGAEFILRTPTGQEIKKFKHFTR